MYFRPLIIRNPRKILAGFTRKGKCSVSALHKSLIIIIIWHASKVCKLVLKWILCIVGAHAESEWY